MSRQFGNVKTQSEYDADVSKKVSAQSKEISSQQLDISFVPEKPIRTIDDLIVSEKTKSEITEVLSKITYHDILYQTWNLKSIDPFGSRTIISFFGPPGTGKSLAADVIASSLGKTIIKVSYAELESKYVGETPKNIEKAFKHAKETDSVIFFDEADSILGKRLTNVTQSSDHGVNVSRSVMLMALNSFEGIVVFATNLSQNYDSAFARRILAHIEMPLPDEPTRIRLLQHHLPKELPLKDNVDISILASESEGLSGGDILNLVIKSATKAVMRLDDRMVSMVDFRQAIQEIRVGKEAISGVRATQETMAVSDAPEDIQQEVSKRICKEHSNQIDNQLTEVVDVKESLEEVSKDETIKRDEKVYYSIEGIALSYNDWKLICGFWWLIIHADDHVDAQEKNLLQQLMKANRIEHFKFLSDFDLVAPSYQEFDVHNLSYNAKIFALRDAIRLAFVDGEYHHKEKEVVEEVASRLEIPNSTVEKLTDWVVQGQQWQNEGMAFFK